MICIFIRVSSQLMIGFLRGLIIISKNSKKNFNKTGLMRSSN